MTYKTVSGRHRRVTPPQERGTVRFVAGVAAAVALALSVLWTFVGVPSSARPATRPGRG